MLKPIYLRKALTVICLASLLNLSSASFPGLVAAQESSESTRVGFPSRRVGGATRGGCDINEIEEPLIALIPANSPGLTAAESPKLFFYIPQTPKPAKVKFVLRDRSDRVFYQTTLTTTGNSEIISIPASEQLKPLEIDRDYHWNLSMTCNLVVLEVKGSIRRVELDPTLAKQLDQATPIERVRLYREANLWHDALASLVELKRSRPDDPAVLNAWTQMLQDVEFDDYLEMFGDRLQPIS